MKLVGLGPKRSPFGMADAVPQSVPDFGEEETGQNMLRGQGGTRPLSRRGVCASNLHKIIGIRCVPFWDLARSFRATRVSKRQPPVRACPATAELKDDLADVVIAKILGTDGVLGRCPFGDWLGRYGHAVIRFPHQ